MLSITQSTPSKRVTANILPCEIAYTGNTATPRRFWNPHEETIKGDSEGSNEKRVQVTYFRGRKLLGRTTALPDGYRGVIVSGEKNSVAQQETQQGSAFSRLARRDEDEDDEDQDSPGAEDGDGDGHDHVALESMDQTSTFQDVTVWEHEVVPGPEEPFSRGIEEWLAFSQVVHET